MAFERPELSQTPAIPLVLRVGQERESGRVVNHQYKPTAWDFGAMDIPVQVEDAALGLRRVQLLPHEFRRSVFLRYAVASRCLADF